ncbi:phage tail tube protein [Lawsonibacter sp. LCP25S3_G6]|uniref:phage tail tube protein n=1 Tax=unclassified Lawsonibacter TaxID=2617946 RepID=UPI003F96C7A2
MSTIDSAKRVMSGTFGEFWWDGELIAECYKFTAKYTQTKEPVNLARQMIEDGKVMSSKGTGSIGFYKVYSRFKDYADAVRDGKDVRGNFVSKLDDPDAYGSERVAIYNVSLDEVPLVNWERKTISKDEVPFTFTSHKFLDTAA